MMCGSLMVGGSGAGFPGHERVRVFQCAYTPKAMVELVSEFDADNVTVAMTQEASNRLTLTVKGWEVNGAICQQTVNT